MSSIRNNKNIQSAVASSQFVGLQAEICHVSDLFSTKFHSDDGMDVFATLKQLQAQYTELYLKVHSLKLTDLKDVQVSNVANGDTLVMNNGVWQPAEFNADEEVKTS